MAEEAVHRWIMALDIEGFSTRPNPIQASLRRAMYEVLDEARKETGLGPGDLETEDRGDGVLMLARADLSPIVLAGPLLRALKDGLDERAPRFSAEHALRLRLSLHQGLASPDPRGWSGDAVNTACRLVDAQPLREVLKAADRARIAFIVSDEIYQGVIRHAYRTIDAAAYLPVDFVVKHDVRLRAWITVPGYPAPPLPEAAAGAPTPQHPAPQHPAPQPGHRPEPGQRPSVTFHAGTVQGDQVAGDKYVYGSGPSATEAP